MEISRDSLDILPKRGFSYLEGNFEEGDLFRIFIGFSNQTKYENVLNIERKGSAILFYFEDSNRQKIIKNRHSLDYFLYYMICFQDKLLRDINNSKLRTPMMMKNKIKIRSVIERGDRTVRYLLEKKDGEKLEILT